MSSLKSVNVARRDDATRYGSLGMTVVFAAPDFDRLSLTRLGGVGFGVRTEAESRMRTECRETGTTGSDVTIEERRRAR